MQRLCSALLSLEQQGCSSPWLGPWEGGEAHAELRSFEIFPDLPSAVSFVSLLCTCDCRVSQEHVNGLGVLCVLGASVRLEELLGVPGKCHFYRQCSVRGICSKSLSLLPGGTTSGPHSLPHSTPWPNLYAGEPGEMGAAGGRNAADPPLPSPEGRQFSSIKICHIYILCLWLSSTALKSSFC